jgi:flagellar assembly factor FliW
MPTETQLATSTADDPTVEESSTIELVRPMIGFPEARRFALRSLGQDFAPYGLLSSLDQLGLAFVIAPPGALFNDYVFEIPEAEVALLGLVDASDVETYVLVTRKGVPVPTVNLMGPLVVHRRTRQAIQVVLQDGQYGAAVAVNAASAHA